MTANFLEPLFSVILPTYNRAYCIDRAIRSVLQQHEQSWELIIVDDGSTDATFDVVRPFALQSERIRIIVQSNQGTGAARQSGILLARGKFVTFLDSDDEYAPEHLATRRAAIEQYPECDFFYGGVAVEGSPYVPDKNNPSRLISIDQCAVGGTFVVRTSVARKLGFAPLRYGDDADFFERASSAGITMVHVPTPTYRYNRTSMDSLCWQQAQLHNARLD